ncbi:MAG: ABC transporter ATP-binding protein [Actinobacteria bacterium]|nr:ABC transporter ATP-binding protein [Actinomycetota bacterium]NDC81706.1 ABC transporter ATP-binding protein [Actinomycetota bacterium]NDD51833.1 ABC transporter ATP-binding protein [Actinomycetota bacterium]NDF43731.1 ABC transporter ATP-binding protein [Actinomycetota bacterium]NDF93829.1 ABC transporter ATP-binding protein [Actinomycetota bacterium]
MKTLLEIEGVSKSFGSVVANENISLTVKEGEILALLGENGAGKSTLVKAVFGLVKPDSGIIKINGTVMESGDTAAAIASGVGMVHQHFQLVPVMSVTENLILGDEPKRFGVVNIKRARKEALALSEKYGLEVDPDAIIEDLPVGMAQRVEILKALRRDVKLLILDEPTAVLTPQETDELLEVLRNLAKRGVGILFITHKLREVMAVADRIAVLRGGKLMGTTTPKESSEAKLAQMMVGREVVLRVEKSQAKPKQVLLSIKNLRVSDDRKLESVKDLSLEVHAGEILGIAGVEGNGQRELVEAICSMRSRLSGEVIVKGQEIPNLNPRAAHLAGVSHIPEDREKHGLVTSYSIADNLVLNRFDQAPFAKGWIRNLEEVADNGEVLVEKFDIRAPNADLSAGSLSGGNKQKVVVARELSQKLDVVVAAQPTRGVDVGSIEFIHNQLIAARDAGAAVLLVSAELDEILSLADRIAVISNGKIVAIFSSKEADRNTIGRLMAGLAS